MVAVVQVKNDDKWIDVSEPLEHEEAKKRQEYHQRQYPHNKYRLRTDPA